MPSPSPEYPAPNPQTIREPKQQIEKSSLPLHQVPPPPPAFQGVSWFAFALGAITFLYSVWYATGITVGERYFLYTAALFSLYGCMGVSKVVRDKEENIPVTVPVFIQQTFHKNYLNPTPQKG